MGLLYGHELRVQVLLHMLEVLVRLTTSTNRYRNGL
jgi:hypothetical protein